MVIVGLSVDQFGLLSYSSLSKSDYRPNWTPLSPITIINRATSFLNLDFDPTQRSKFVLGRGYFNCAN